MNIEEYSKKIVTALINSLKIKPYDLCICGTGKKYKNCCFKKSGKELFFIDNTYNKILKYKDSQGGKIRYLPQIFFKKLKKSSLNRLTCLIPGCIQKPISCHLIPENILKKEFGEKCLVSSLRDKSLKEEFIETGLDEAGAFPVFCSKHDNEIFQSIDKLEINYTSKKQLFLIAFKTIAFALRNIQYLIGIDFQVEIFRPLIIHENLEKASNIKSNVEINIAHLSQQYIRFKIIYESYMNAINYLEKEDWNYFSHFHRIIKCKDSIFCSNLINLSHDLSKNRINLKNFLNNMIFNIFAKEGLLHILFSCSDGINKTTYNPFFEQLKNTDNQTLIHILNNILTIKSENIYIPQYYKISKDDYEKINYLRELSKRSMKISNNIIFDLKDSNNSVAFIKI